MARRCCWVVMVVILTIILGTSPVFAVPGLINYQGKLTDSGGNSLDGVFSMTFLLYSASSDGSSLWNETQSVSVTDGIYSIELGSVSPFPAGLFDNAALYLEVVIGGETLSPRQPLTSTAFAMKAADADTLDGRHASAFMNAGGDTMAGDLAVDGAVAVNDNLSVSGTSTLQAVTIGTPSTQSSNSTSPAESSVEDNLTVWGPTTLQGGARIGGFLEVNGPAAFLGTALFAGQTTLINANLTTATFVSMTGSFISADSADLKKATINKVTGPVYFEKDIAVKGQAALSSVLSYLVDTDKVDTFLVDADKVDANIIVATQKYFRVPNPRDPHTEIWYSSLEGPELAAYVRGTDLLVNGKATISLPDHFIDVADPNSVTVHLTPNSAESLGLAVIEKSLDGVVVRELANGTGTYEFDYYIMAVRRGYEDYKVIRPIQED